MYRPSAKKKGHDGAKVKHILRIRHACPREGLRISDLIKKGKCRSREYEYLESGLVKYGIMMIQRKARNIAKLKFGHYATEGVG